MAASPTILFTNDDLIYLDLMHAILTRAGYDSVVTIPNKDAYLTACIHQPALILIDISFGAEPDGWATLDRLTLDPRTTHIPLIVCSTDSRFLRAKAAWFTQHHVGVLEKPFNVPEVVAIIANTLAVHP